jgi:penicillin-binding protein 2
VVVLDPNSGEVLALASRPNYDPNIFLEPLDQAAWQQLSGGRHPFMNRALAIYPPGSTFKVVTLSAALELGLVKPGETFYCPGYYKVNNRIARCWKESGHGRLTVQEGLVQSCDIVFYELGRRLGPDRFFPRRRKGWSRIAPGRKGSGESNGTKAIRSITASGRAFCRLLRCRWR